ncbi:MAG TPA: DUF1634 domain-containing protein [Candidatus Limnocylindrales bacterium]|nr:DUF1634 domain-containing protein [Candidatus Limnocylindrales bacterium]
MATPATPQMPPHVPPTGTPPANLELALAHVLQLGTYVSVALIGLGSILLLAGGGSPLDPGPPLDLARLPGDLVALRPAGFLWLGIVGVVATPALRVGRALLGFLRRDEQRMVAVSALVLGVILVGVIVGVMAR